MIQAVRIIGHLENELFFDVLFNLMKECGTEINCTETKKQELK